MPNETLYIPTSARLIIILQLCVGLSCFLWLLGYPFMGGHFKTQSELMLIEATMGKADVLKRIDPSKAAQFEEKTALRHAVFFAQEPSIRIWLEQEEAKREDELKRPFIQKLTQALHLFAELPLFELLWIILAVVIPLALLLRWKMALPAVWLLPFCTLMYAWGNFYYGADPMAHSDQELFPKEAELVATPASRKDLESAWEKYLITEWAHELPSDRPEHFSKQLAQGEFHFNVERIRRSPTSLSHFFWEQKPLWLLGGYVIWNLFFAYFISRHVFRTKSTS